MIEWLHRLLYTNLFLFFSFCDWVAHIKQPPATRICSFICMEMSSVAFAHLVLLICLLSAVCCYFYYVSRQSDRWILNCTATTHRHMSIEHAIDNNKQNKYCNHCGIVKHMFILTYQENNNKKTNLFEIDCVELSQCPLVRYNLERKSLSWLILENLHKFYRNIYWSLLYYSSQASNYCAYNLAKTPSVPYTDIFGEFVFLLFVETSE